MSIKEWPEDERPREKLLRQGPGGLSDAELLAIFLRTGVSGLSAVDLPAICCSNLVRCGRCLAPNSGLLRGARSRTGQICPAAGRAGDGQRHLAEQLQRGDPLTSPQLTRDYLQAQLRDRPRRCLPCCCSTTSIE